MKSVLILALVMGAAVLWTDVDTQVAKYNVEHYLCGDLAQVDLSHLYGLGPGAVEYMEKLTTCDDPTIRSRATAFLRTWYLGEDEDFRGMNRMEQKALEILEKYRPEESAEAVDTP